MKNKHYTAKYLLKIAFEKNLGTKEDKDLIRNYNINELLDQASNMLAQKDNSAIKTMIFNKIKSLMNEEDAKKYNMEDLERHLAKTNLIK